MSADVTPTSPAALASDDDAPLCPVCGYDLRGTPGDICSECGHTIDRAALATSGFPWAHRREIGRIRAYIKTVWQVTIDSRKLRFEASRPQDLKDAPALGRVTAAIVGLLLAGGCVAAIVAAGGPASMAVQPEPPFQPGQPQAPWLQDIAVPWCAGATMWPVLPAMMLLFGFHLSGAQGLLFRLKDATPKRAQRTAAIGHYASAPMAWLVLTPAVGAAVGAIVSGVAYVYLPELQKDTWLLAAIITAEAFVAAVLLTTFGRIAQWAVRVRHAHFERGLLSVAYLLGAWLLGLLVLVGVLPWSIGYVWIFIDRLR